MKDIINNNVFQFILCFAILIAYVMTYLSGSPSPLLESILLLTVGHYFGSNSTPNSQVTDIVRATAEVAKVQ